MTQSRNAHYMMTSKGGYCPRNVLCVACYIHADGELVWAISCWSRDAADHEGGRVGTGRTPGEFWSTVRRFIGVNAGTWMIFHGACHCLTLLDYWDRVEEDLWQLTGVDPANPDRDEKKGGRQWEGYAVMADPPTCILTRPTNAKGSVVILDARNFGIMSNAAELPDDGLDANPLREAMRKAMHLEEFMSGWIRTIQECNLGGVRMTAASQAMHSYRYRFLRSPVLVHTNYSALALERQAMHAGRCECWHLGCAKGPVYHLDVNSFYPAVSRCQMMPSRLAGFADGGKADVLQLAKKGFLVIAEVTLDARERHYPVKFSWTRHGDSYRRGMGSRCKVRPADGDVIYPVGIYHTALCGPELMHALKANVVRKVHSVAWYEGSDLFTTWSDQLHALNAAAKLKGDHWQSECLKRVRNSLFGKFAQWGWQWQDCPTTFPKGPFCTWYGPPPLTADGKAALARDAEMGEEREPQEPQRLMRYRAIGWKCQMEQPTGEHPESCPAISAWVYSLARARLLQFIDSAGENNVYYMDSDSLWVNHTGLNSLRRDGHLDAKEMGRMRVVGCHEWVNFHGLKDYEFEGASVSAGLPANATRLVGGGWQFWTPETVAGALQHGRHPGKEMVSHKHSGRRVYRHGTRDIAGRVMPIVLSEE